MRNPSYVAGPREELPDQSDGEAELFSKGVPQVQDLLASWTACKSNQSWVNAATNVRLFQYGSFTRGWEQQIWIRLSEAGVVSLAMDDRGNDTLIRFACDIGLAPPHASTELGSHRGILGVLDTSLGLTEEDFNEDYAKRVVEQLSMAIQFFFHWFGAWRCRRIASSVILLQGEACSSGQSTKQEC